MEFKAQISKREIMFIPTFGIIDERGYYGYPVVAIAFAWLTFKCKIELGVKKWRADNG